MFIGKKGVIERQPNKLSHPKKNGSMVMVKTSSLLERLAQLHLPVMPVQVEFGVLSKDCVNFGICKVIRIQLDDLPLWSAKKGNQALGLLYVNAKKQIQIDIQKSTMWKKTKNLYFEKEIFFVEEDFAWPNEVKLELKWEEKLSVGKYPFEEDQNWIYLPMASKLV